MNPAADTQRAAAQAARLRDFYATLTPAQLVVQSKMSLASMMKAPSDVERAAAWSATSDARTAGLAVYEMMTTDLRPAVAAIRTPVLLIGAAEFAKDAETRARVHAAYEQQVAAVPNHRVVLAEDARHFVMWDVPISCGGRWTRSSRRPTAVRRPPRAEGAVSRCPPDCRCPLPWPWTTW